MMERLTERFNLRNLLAAEKDGRLAAITPEQQPHTEWTKERPQCFYTDRPNGYYCLGFCRRNDDDEPINPCKCCWWLDGNDDLRAEAALRGAEESSAIGGTNDDEQ